MSQIKTRQEGARWVRLSAVIRDDEGRYRDLVLSETLEMLVKGGSIIRHITYGYGDPDVESMVFVPEVNP